MFEQREVSLMMTLIVKEFVDVQDAGQKVVWPQV
jgi:hypothetical protein